MGPLTSKQHQERVLHFVKVAKEEGGEVLAGGRVPDREDLAKGCFVEPTIVSAKRPTRSPRKRCSGRSCR